MGARIALTAVAAPGCYANPVSAGMTPCTITDGNYVTMTGNDLLIIQNIHATNAYTATITSTADVLGRSGDITTFSIPALTTYVWGPVKQLGWQQAGNQLWLLGSNANILFGVVKLG